MEWRNLLLPYKVIKSLLIAKRVVRNFGADIVVGFGGYASAPVLWAAQREGIPTIIQEQTPMLGSPIEWWDAVQRGCVLPMMGWRGSLAVELVLTGNPLRGNFTRDQQRCASEALNYLD